MKAGKKFLNLITDTDIFGDPILFTLNKKETPKTLFGGIMTSSLIILMTILFCFQIRDPLGKLYPRISSFINVEKVVPPMNFSRTEMPFAFAITDDKGNEYDDLVFDVRLVNYTVKNSNWIETFTALPTIKCPREYFSKISDEDYLNYRLDKYACIKDQNFTIEGFINDISYTSLSFRALFCKEDIVDGKAKQSDPNCNVTQQRELLKERDIQSIYVSLYFNNPVFNSRNYSYPKEYYPENIFSYLNVDEIKHILLTFSRQNLITDDGLILTTEETQTITSLEDVRYDSFSTNFDENILSVIYLHSSNKEYTSIRAYNKIPSVMADVRGLFEYIRFVLKIFCVIFSDSKKKLTLMNKLFEFDLKDPLESKRKSLRKTTLRDFTVISKDRDRIRNEIDSRMRIGNNQVARGDFTKILRKEQTIMNDLNDTTSQNPINNSNINNEHSNPNENNKSSFEVGNSLSPKHKFKDPINNEDLYNRNNVNVINEFIEIQPHMIFQKNSSIKNEPMLEKNEINLKSYSNFKGSKRNNNSVSNRIINSIDKKETAGNKIIEENGEQFFNPQTAKYVYVMTKVKSKNDEFKDYYGLKKQIKLKRKLTLSNMEKLKINLLRSCIKDKAIYKKLQLFQIAENKLEEMFEISYLMNKLDEVDKMKIILFNKQQMALFDISSRELCSLNVEALRNSECNQLREFKNDHAKFNVEMEKFRKKMKLNPDYLTETDERLFSLLPFEVKEYLGKSNNS